MAGSSCGEGVNFAWLAGRTGTRAGSGSLGGPLSVAERAELVLLDGNSRPARAEWVGKFPQLSSTGRARCGPPSWKNINNLSSGYSLHRFGVDRRFRCGMPRRMDPFMARGKWNEK